MTAEVAIAGALNVGGEVGDLAARGFLALLIEVRGGGEQPLGLLKDALDVGFRFPFDPHKTDIIYRVVASADLIDWSAAIYDSSTDSETIPENGHITLPVEFADFSTRFLRLVVELEQ